MIDIESETLITFSEAARLIPSRHGKPPHVSTIVRWALHGRRGVRLEFIQTPGGKLTSREAMSRFFGRLTIAEQDAPVRPMAQRERDVARAERQLKQFNM